MDDRRRPNDGGPLRATNAKSFFTAESAEAAKKKREKKKEKEKGKLSELRAPLAPALTSRDPGERGTRDPGREAGQVPGSAHSAISAVKILER